jgi:DNA-binding XRE family transcriptional regulator
MSKAPDGPAIDVDAIDMPSALDGPSLDGGLDETPLTISQILQDFLRKQEMTQEELANKIGTSRRHVHDLCIGASGLTPTMALRLAPVLAVSPYRLAIVHACHMIRLAKIAQHSGSTPGKPKPKKKPRRKT